MKFLCTLLSVLMLTTCAFGACAEAETVAFADVAVEQAIRETLGVSADAPLTTDDLAMILEFDGEAGEIQTLEDFALCKNLESFILRGSKTPAYDLTPFAGLEKLRFFRIDGDVLNTAPVAALPELTALQIGGSVTQLDLSPLAGRDNLTAFFLTKRALEGDTDLTPLKSHANLKQATLPKLREGELRPLLESWPNLQYLNVWGGPVTTDDLAALATRKLQVLSLNPDKPIDDFSPLAKQKELFRVQADRMTDAGLESLAESVPGLQKLYLNGALLIDFSPLLRLENLEQINMYVGDGLALRETLKDTAVEINNEM
ncbi:MAG: hypothetical protein SOW23_07730 [Eubacteriales bacterium]|nr:hypothetical protein [Eubacteriales bacterium]